MYRKETIEEGQRPSQPKSMHWELAKREMTGEEVQKIRDMNWEWYYNCFLYKDEPIAIACKICGAINVFQPGEMKKKCGACGIESRRCEVDEDEK